MNYYAHSQKNAALDQWHRLDDHANAVAILAADFAAPFHSEQWGRWLGLLHDLGKARQSFQSYLKIANDLTDENYDGAEHSHSGVGAVWANRTFPKHALSRVAAYCVAGHHAGLADWTGGDTPGGALALRLEKEQKLLDEETVRSWIAQQASLQNPSPPQRPWGMARNDLSFWIRMLFSCLVDADYLDTEAFMDPAEAALRSRYPSLHELATPFFAALDNKQKAAPDTPVNRIRAEIRAACETAAEDAAGFFSLTVPTGGGKTLSGMAFALAHALKHGLKRVIYVIPYTSIIEQTADVLREFVGANNVVEHHSNIGPTKETQQSRLASENWDAPIVVTTNVQFFESLYACKPGRCRKLHNIAESVVVLDEAQLLPPHLLLPCVEALQQLVAHYRVSVVLSTATQPALPGLTAVREIIPPDMNLYSRLKRTQLIFPESRTTRQSWAEIAAELREHDQVLCIVNTRRDCRDLHALLPSGTIHLSASMCGEHRSRVIAHIKEKLQAEQPIRVVSTQLVEAGVDIDFPVLYRAFAGLSSIAQAAGRCNREGRQATLGRVVIFMPPQAAPPGELRKAEDTLSSLLEYGLNAESPDSYPKYFEHFYAAQNDLGTAFANWLSKDAGHLQFQFRKAAKAFQIIDDQESAPVIVRYGDNAQLLGSLHAVGPKRDIMRGLQRYTVNVQRRTLIQLLIKGFVQEIHPGIYVQVELSSLYSEVFGLDLLRQDLPPEDLFIWPY
jgi:CRISPR-associated endonuclease/helicase Cas3